MPSNSSTPSSRPVAGEETSEEKLPNVGRHEAARELWAARRNLTENAALIETLVSKLETAADEIARLTREQATRTAALDALREAVKPVREEYDAAVAGLPDAVLHTAQPTVVIDTVELRALLDALSALLGGDDATA